MRRRFALFLFMGLGSLAHAETSPTPETTTPPAAAPSPIPSPAPRLVLSEPTRIDAREWHGLTRTRESVVELELPWKPGDVVSPADFQLGMDRLGNLNMFTEVKCHFEEREGKRIAVFDVQERWTLKPVISGAFGGNSYWFILGVSERNLLGRNLMGEVLYQNFNGVHGGRLYFEDPRFLNTFTDLQVWAERMLRTRPFNTVQRTKGRVGIFKTTNQDMVQAGGTVEVFQDAFYPSLTGVSTETRAYTGVFFEPYIKLGRINRVRILKQGRTLEVRPQLGWMAEASPTWYGQMNIDAISFWKPHARINLVGRIKLGAMTRAPNQVQYFLGGADVLRGYPDNSIQTENYGLYNFDFRFVAFDHDWIAIVPYAFHDGVISYGSAQGARPGLSVGAGILFTSPMIVDSELRVDISFPYQAGTSGPSFGLSTVGFY